MFTKRQKSLVRILEEGQTSITAKKLAEKLGVSSKTVRNDIVQINQVGPAALIDSKAGAGYSLKTLADLEPFLEEPTEIDNLRFEILKYLLYAESIDFYQVAEDFFISESTLSRAIRDINQVIASRYDNLSICRNNNLLHVSGGEEGKRLIFNLFLNQEIENHKLSLAAYGDYFEYSDLTMLSQFVIQHHKAIGFRMNDFSTISFILHIAVLVERISQGSYLETGRLPQCDEKSYELAQEFANQLKSVLKIEVPASELYYIARLYTGKIILPEADLEQKFLEIVTQVIQQVNDSFLIDFSEDQRMKEYLTAHLSALYGRSMQKQYLNNPLTEEVKNKYPFIYNVSVFAAAIFQEKLAIRIPEDEIAYITLHFLSASENIHYQKKRKILVISPYGIASRRLIRNKLKKLEFPLEIIEGDSIFDSESKIDPSLDLIIATEKLAVEQGPPIFYCSSMFDEKDLLAVKELLEEKDRKPTILHDFFKEELFFPQQSFKTKEEVICFLCDNLERLGYCDSSYQEKVLSREGFSSTSFGNYYAIPHAIERSAFKNCVAVCCLTKPIDWGNNKVKIVFLMALKKERDNSFEALFNSFSQVLDDSQLVKDLAKQTDFSDFIQLYQK